MNDIKPPGPGPSPRPASKPEPVNLPSPMPGASLASVADAVPPPVFTPEKRRIGRLILGVVLALVLIAAVGLFWWYKDALQPRSGDMTQVRVKVVPGTSWDGVVGQLAEKKLIKSKLAATIYLRLHRSGNLKAGTYVLAPNQSLPQIIEWLGQGKVDIRRFTIISGKTVAELETDFIKQGYTKGQVQAALAKTYDHPLLADKPPGASLEGYLYPETYFITTDETLDHVFVRAFDQFQKLLIAKQLPEALAKKGFTLYQGITLGSVIEKEVNRPEDRRQVAQVFEKRLAQNMVMGSDVTYQYGAKLLGVEPSPALDSPYNTRIHPGLPPGPIANIDISLLEAVLNPSAGDFLFFVAGDDGITHFSMTEAEHNNNVQKYCKKLCYSN